MKIAVTHGILVTHLKALAHRICEDTKEAFSFFFLEIIFILLRGCLISVAVDGRDLQRIKSAHITDFRQLAEHRKCTTLRISHRHELLKYREVNISFLPRWDSSFGLLRSCGYLWFVSTRSLISRAYKLRITSAGSAACSRCVTCARFLFDMNERIWRMWWALQYSWRLSLYRYVPYNPNPESLKRRTDAAFALLDKMQKLQVNFTYLRAREGKALSQVDMHRE